MLERAGSVGPRFDAFFDARFLNETEVMARVVDPLLLGVTVSVLHDTRPPDTVVPTDVRLFGVSPPLPA